MWENGKVVSIGMGKYLVNREQIGSNGVNVK